FGKKDIFFLVMNEPDLVVDTFGRSNTCTQLGGSGNDSGAKEGIFGQTNNGEGSSTTFYFTGSTSGSLYAANGGQPQNSARLRRRTQAKGASQGIWGT
ncbi:hypothetical protein TrRE_jg10560, partial [Triparma retinervis]